jgi:hypothetical protein
VSSGPASDGGRCDAAGEGGPGSPSRIPRGLTGAVTPHTLIIRRAKTALSSVEETPRQRHGGDDKWCSSVDRQDCVLRCCRSRIGAANPNVPKQQAVPQNRCQGAKAFADACRRGQLSVHAAAVYCRARAGYLRELVALLPGLPRFTPNLCKPCICSRHIHATSTEYPMSSCRLAITSSGSITDCALGNPSIAGRRSACRPSERSPVPRRCAPVACRGRGVRRV